MYRRILACFALETRGKCACDAVWRVNVAERAEKPVARLLGAFTGLFGRIIGIARHDLTAKRRGSSVVLH
jgi:hypothetical protein